MYLFIRNIYKTDFILVCRFPGQGGSGQGSAPAGGGSGGGNFAEDGDDDLYS